MSRIAISCFFYDFAGGPRDKAAHWIFKNHGGRFVGGGTMLIGVRSGERDVQYLIPAHRARSCRKALVDAGFRLQPTPDPMANES